MGSGSVEKGSEDRLVSGLLSQGCLLRSVDLFVTVFLEESSTVLLYYNLHNGDDPIGSVCKVSTKEGLR